MNPALDAILSLFVWALSLAAVFICGFTFVFGGASDGPWFYGSLLPAIGGACWILCRITSNRGW
jgi:hypothetical protein